MASDKTQVVAIVDDDESIRNALCGLLKSYDLEPRPFSSAAEFLDSDDRDDVACVITDIQMPGMSGLELQSRLSQEHPQVPVIFITAYGEPKVRAQAMSTGAFALLEKPFDNHVLMDSIRAALELKP